MLGLLSRTWILLISLALIATLVPTGRSPFAYAEEDELDNDDDIADSTADEASVAEEGSRTDDDDSDDGKLSASPDAETTILFTKPAGAASSELPAGQIAEFLVGFSNKGNRDMIIETVEAAFHYPMDHTFVIQNFSAIQYYKLVKPQQQATVAYSFIPAEPFAGRPFGLSINLAYRNNEGRVFSEAVFNETINIVEVDEGLDGETFFLYLFLAAGVVLMLVLGQQALASMGKRRGGGSRLETGTARNTGSVSDDGIDYDWLPQSTIKELNKSPKNSPRRSPRLRKTKGGSSSD
ncbi:translocon-associated protein subunit alpha-like [Daphnia carinata]|uniref:translocon-associated protein subunit alpha-like n=1 Tax=Daphnia carinata TaxID=120202 RepID=UPI002580E08B|nr:translocon-associated protein subunit alpha-like [Daphnia carinata]